MKASELIKELKETIKDYWDVDVVVQYRDAWWAYYWYDDCIDLEFKDWKMIL